MDSNNKGINNFDVLKKMSADNMDILLLPNGTNRHAVEVKGENAYITYGAPKELGLRFLKGEKFVGGVILANESQYNEVKAKLEDDHNIRYIILMRYSNSNMWYVVENLSDDGENIDHNLFFGIKDNAVNYAKSIIEFDEEENGPPVEGINYMVIPVPFDSTIVEPAGI